MIMILVFFFLVKKKDVNIVLIYDKYSLITQVMHIFLSVMFFFFDKNLSVMFLRLVHMI